MSKFDKVFYYLKAILSTVAFICFCILDFAGISAIFNVDYSSLSGSTKLNIALFLIFTITLSLFCAVKAIRSSIRVPCKIIRLSDKDVWANRIGFLFDKKYVLKGTYNIFTKTFNSLKGTYKEEDVLLAFFDNGSVYRNKSYHSNS